MKKTESVKKPKTEKAPGAKKTKNRRKLIVFVCTGNTCRSPMAEVLMRTLLKERKIKWWDVTSCGLEAQEGSPMTLESREALFDIGADPGEFRSKQITQKILDKSTIVFTMTADQKKALEGRAHVFCIKDVTGREVPDPYGKSYDSYKAARDELKCACEKIADEYVTSYTEGKEIK